MLSQVINVNGGGNNGAGNLRPQSLYMEQL